MLVNEATQCDIEFVDNMNQPGVDRKQICPKSYTHDKRSQLNLPDILANASLSQIFKAATYIHGKALITWSSFQVSITM